AYAVSNLRNFNGDYNKNNSGEYDAMNVGNHGEQVELRIVSREKPHPEAVEVEPVLEDAYLYYYI
ncbi:MAG: hypothetical protein K2G55_03695, partial [Lachnospiraceae bacterium]|nr:hypothetical protein [Lachnospiraceae bacterium]